MFKLVQASVNRKSWDPSGGDYRFMLAFDPINLMIPWSVLRQLITIIIFYLPWRVLHWIYRLWSAFISEIIFPQSNAENFYYLVNFNVFFQILTESHEYYARQMTH